MATKIDNDTNLAALSDEEVANIDISSLNIDSMDLYSQDGVEEEEEEEEEDTSDTSDTSDTDTTDGEDLPSDTDEVDDEETDDVDETTDGETTEETSDVVDSDDKEEEVDDEVNKTEKSTSKDDSVDDKLTETKDEDTTDTQVDTTSDKYKAEQFDKLLAPFNANKMEMQVTSVDEALQLMKMGVNYNGKMKGLKPVLRINKMLENNNLLDEEKLNFLIDVSKGDKDAITKLIKQHGINPMDVDVNADTQYKPKTYTVDDTEVELGEILTEISESSTYTETMDIVKTKLDLPSRQVIADQPQLLRVINEHVASGVYAKIMGAVEKERLVGSSLSGMSDLQAYKVMGDSLYPATPKATEQPAKTVVKTKTPKAENPKLKARRKAASSTKTPAKATSVSEEFDPLSLSDEDFEKHMAAGKIKL